MSQRGGCCLSHVRNDSESKSSYIPLHSADVIIGFELAETARNLVFLKPDGHCIVNTQMITPVPVSLGLQKYNATEAREFIETTVKNPIFIDAYSLAEKAGSIKTVNIVLLGSASKAGMLPFERDLLLNNILTHVPQKFRDLNEKAFIYGEKAVSL